jgi:integrase
MPVSKRPNSSYWYIQFQYNGKTYIKSSKTTDKAIAKQMESLWRSQLVQSHQLGVKPSISTTEAFQRYSTSKSDLSSHKALSRWCRRATTYFNNHSLTNVHQITSRDIESWRISLQQSGLGNQSIKHAMNQVGAMVKYMKKLGYNVAEIELPTIRTSKGRLRYLSIDEERRLLAEIDPYREVKGLPPFEERHTELQRQMVDFYDLVILLLDTGARQGEICRLSWEQIDLSKRTIQLWRPKVSNESVLYMTNRVYQILLRRSNNPDGSHVFRSKSGVNRNHTTNPFRKAFKRAEIDGATAHTLRHTHATRLIQHGLSLYEVKEILGHSDIKTTMRYAHIEQQSVSRKATMVIDRFNGDADGD